MGKWHNASRYYDYATESNRKRVIAENKRTDETIVFFIEKQTLQLRDKYTRRIVEFRHYLFRGQWRWRDSRYEKPVNFDHVMREVSRMLDSPAMAKKVLTETIFG